MQRTDALARVRHSNLDKGASLRHSGADQRETRFCLVSGMVCPVKHWVVVNTLSKNCSTGHSSSLQNCIQESGDSLKEPAPDDQNFEAFLRETVTSVRGPAGRPSGDLACLQVACQVRIAWSLEGLSSASNICATGI